MTLNLWGKLYFNSPQTREKGGGEEILLVRLYNLVASRVLIMRTNIRKSNLSEPAIYKIQENTTQV